jgi:hypothetical protein
VRPTSVNRAPPVQPFPHSGTLQGQRATRRPASGFADASPGLGTICGRYRELPVTTPSTIPTRPSATCPETSPFCTGRQNQQHRHRADPYLHCDLPQAYAPYRSRRTAQGAPPPWGCPSTVPRGRARPLTTCGTTARISPVIETRQNLQIVAGFQSVAPGYTCLDELNRRVRFEVPAVRKTDRFGTGLAAYVSRCRADSSEVPDNRDFDTPTCRAKSAESSGSKESAGCSPAVALVIPPRSDFPVCVKLVGVPNGFRLDA